VLELQYQTGLKKLVQEVEGLRVVVLLQAGMMMMTGINLVLEKFVLQRLLFLFFTTFV